MATGGLCLDLRLVTTEKDEQPPLGPRVLHSYSHEFLDQLAEDNLARESLGRLDYSLDVQLRDGRANRGNG